MRGGFRCKAQPMNHSLTLCDARQLGMLVGVLAFALLVTGCDHTKQAGSASPRPSSALTKYVNASQGFMFAYDRASLINPALKSAGPKGGYLRLLFNGTTYQGLLFTMAVTDRNPRDVRGSVPGQFSVTVLRATRPVVLPAPAALRHAEKLLFVAIRPSAFDSRYYGIGSLGRRTIVRTTFAGAPAIKLSMRWDDSRATQYWVAQGNVLCAVSMRATATAWPAIAPAFEAAAKSFTILR